MKLSDHAAALGVAQRELAAAIDRQSKPERGWTLEDWGRHVTRDVEAARAKRDAVAAEYRAAVAAWKRALAAREPGYWAAMREHGDD